MIPEVGSFALLAALLIATVQGVLPLFGAWRSDALSMALARPAAATQCLMVAVAYGCLSYAFATNDFSVLYVAEHSNSLLPLIYRFAAVWSGHEGSMLLWVLLLSGWTLAVALFSRSLPQAFAARVLGVLGLISCGLLLFVLLASNPFERLLPIPVDGLDLNPMLQDVGLILHPPMLYLGYVGFSVTYAFAIAALLSGNLDFPWARWMRPWVAAAWAFLTLGIALGSGWAYYELGWGGWWFWDPVENASLMLWLVSAALMHALAVTEKRGAFKNWSILLAIVVFPLSLLGAFLVRSGVLTSVHAFAADSGRGIFLLVFLTLVTGSSLLLFAWRAPKVSLGEPFALASRETLLLLNSLLLLVAAGTVLLGTLYPLLIDALGLGKLSVGPPYFETVLVPLLLPLLFLAAPGIVAQWEQDNIRALTKRLRPATAIAILLGVTLPFALGKWSLLASLGITLAVWIVAATITHIRLTTFRWGMHLAHLGLAVFVIGATLVKGYETGKDVRLLPGDKIEAGGYTLRFAGVKGMMGPNYHAVVGEFELARNDKHLRVLHPEKRVYFSSSMPMTEAAIDTGLFRDIYVSLGEPLEDGIAWSVRVQHKPFIAWIWMGCLLMALGGLAAVGRQKGKEKN